MKQLKIIDEDNNILENLPKNPLFDKWKAQYPKRGICKIFEENNMANYSCINCSRCPEGDLFEVPLEDLKEYREYAKKVKEYLDENRPSLQLVLAQASKKDK